MRTIAEVIKGCPELYKSHAVIINQDNINHIVKYIFKDMSSLEIKTGS